MLVRDKDYLDQCNPGGKLPQDLFAQDVCRVCTRPECVRSAYKDDATRRRLEHANKMLEFVDPTTAPVSPLSNYPDVEAAKAEEPAAAPEPAPAPVEVAAPQPPPQRPADPWEAPKDHRFIDYREIADPKQDPWSVEYEGPRELRISPGQAVVLTGKKNVTTVAGKPRNAPKKPR
jgi:hypothetical protein